MIRARFTAQDGDARPANWPVKHPFWCTGYDSVDRPTVVAYADNEHYVLQNWPDAIDIESNEVDGYVFTDRFKKPEWFVEPEADNA